MQFVFSIDELERLFCTNRDILKEINLYVFYIKCK